MTWTFFHYNALTGSEYVRPGGHSQLAAGQARQHGHPGRASEADLRPPGQRPEEWPGLSGEQEQRW